MKNVLYENWSGAVFSGFYESELFNSDTLYYLTQNDRGEYEIDEKGNKVPVLKEDEEWDMVGDNYSKFETDVSSYAVDVLEELATEYKENKVLSNFRFKGLNSPKYYNYSTDRLRILMDVDVRALKRFCFKEYAHEFDTYLHDNFTSYDGFMSFISNNLHDFKNDYKEHGFDSKEGNVMIEFYLLTCIYETTELNKVNNRFEDGYRYHDRLTEYSNEVLFNYIEPVKS